MNIKQITRTGMNLVIQNKQKQQMLFVRMPYAKSMAQHRVNGLRALFFFFHKSEEHAIYFPNTPHNLNAYIELFFFFFSKLQILFCSFVFSCCAGSFIYYHNIPASHLCQHTWVVIDVIPNPQKKKKNVEQKHRIECQTRKKKKSENRNVHASIFISQFVWIVNGSPVWQWHV